MKNILALSLALLALSARPAQSQDNWQTAATLAAGAYVGLAAIDAKNTYDCVKAGTCVEANPLIRPFVERRGIGPAMAGKVAVNVGMLAATQAITSRWPDRHRMRAVAYVSMMLVQGYVVYRNERVLRGTWR